MVKLLFGLSTKAQLSRIHARVDQLDSLSDQERNQLNLHSKLLNVTMRDISSISSTVKLIERAQEVSGKIIRQFSLNLLSMENAIQLQEAVLDIQSP